MKHSVRATSDLHLFTFISYLQQSRVEDSFPLSSLDYLQLQQSHGSFKQWIEAHHPLRKEEWVKLFKKHFRFTGGEIVNEFLMSTGYLPGAHDEDCPVFKKAVKAGAAWYSARR